MRSLEAKALEYSKVIFDRFCWFFLAQLLLTYLSIPLGFPAEARQLLAISLPLYQAVAIAYYGKAGVENVTKIVQAQARIKTVESDGDSNG